MKRKEESASEELVVIESTIQGKPKVKDNTKKSKVIDYADVERNSSDDDCVVLDNKVSNSIKHKPVESNGGLASKGGLESKGDKPVYKQVASKGGLDSDDFLEFSSDNEIKNKVISNPLIEPKNILNPLIESNPISNTPIEPNPIPNSRIINKQVDPKVSNTVPNLISSIEPRVFNMPVVSLKPAPKPRGKPKSASAPTVQVPALQLPAIQVAPSTTQSTLSAAHLPALPLSTLPFPVKSNLPSQVISKKPKKSDKNTHDSSSLECLVDPNNLTAKYTIMFKHNSYEKTFFLNDKDPIESIYFEIFGNLPDKKLLYEGMKLSRFLNAEDVGFFPGINYISLPDNETLPCVEENCVILKIDQNTDNDIKMKLFSQCTGQDIIKYLKDQGIDINKKALIFNGERLALSRVVSSFIESEYSIDLVDEAHLS